MPTLSRRPPSLVVSPRPRPSPITSHLSLFSLSSPPLRIIAGSRHIANRGNPASHFNLTIQKLQDLQKRSKRRRHFAHQPPVQRWLTDSDLGCDGRVTFIAEVDVIFQAPDDLCWLSY